MYAIETELPLKRTNKEQITGCL